MSITNELQKATDQAICWAIIENQRRGNLHNHDEVDLVPGSVIANLRVSVPDEVHGRPREILVDGLVEQFHFDGIESFQANYPLGCVPGAVTIRVDRPAAGATKEKV